MPLEGGKTNDLQIGVDLRAVVDDLQGFSKQRGALDRKSTRLNSSHP